MKKAKILILLLTSLYIAICIFMYVIQRSLLFFPAAEVSADAEIRSFAINGEQIKVWQLRSEKSEAIVYFGGNAENVAQNIHAYSRLFPNHAVYLVNYRGYAGSSGSPSEHALLADAVAIFDELSSKHQHISVIGRSLGSGVAVHLAATRLLKKMVLVTAYDSVVSVAQQKYFWLPVSLLIKDRFDSTSKISDVKIPILVLSAEHDMVIPYRHTQNLIHAIDGNRLNAVIISGAAHNNIEQIPQYYRILQEFLIAL